MIEEALAKNPNIRTKTVGALADAVGQRVRPDGGPPQWARDAAERARARICAEGRRGADAAPGAGRRSLAAGGIRLPRGEQRPSPAERGAPMHGCLRRREEEPSPAARAGGNPRSETRMGLRRRVGLAAIVVGGGLGSSSPWLASAVQNDMLAARRASRRRSAVVRACTSSRPPRLVNQKNHGDFRTNSAPRECHSPRRAVSEIVSCDRVDVRVVGHRRRSRACFDGIARLGATWVQLAFAPGIAVRFDGSEASHDLNEPGLTRSVAALAGWIAGTGPR